MPLCAERYEKWPSKARDTSWTQVQEGGQSNNAHFEIALYVDTFDEVDKTFTAAVSKGATPVLEPATEPWGQRTCYISDPEGNLIEIGSWNKPFRSWLDKDM